VAVVNSTLDIYEIVHSEDYVDLSSSLSLNIRSHFRLINSLIIPTCCRIEMAANEHSLVLSLNDHYHAQQANNLVYSIPFEKATNKAKCTKVGLNSMPYALSNYAIKKGSYYII